MKPISIAVVGAGHMGMNHLKAYQKREDVNIVGIVDVRPGYTQEIAKQFNCRSLSLDQLPGLVDAVSVVTPSATHLSVGRFLIEKGIHCLIEKPLAMNVEQCNTLVALSQKHKVTLVVGHVEEYNSGFIYLKNALRDTNEFPTSIFCERLNFGSQRIVDADVVLDLMIHDIGCIVDLMGHDLHNVKVVHASGYGRDSHYADVALATLKTPTCLIGLKASRLCHQRHRDFSLHTRNYSYFLDYISQQVSVYRENKLTTQTNHPWMSPLECEIEHFIECVKTPAVNVLTSGKKASLTMKYVEDIQRMIYGR